MWTKFFALFLLFAIVACDTSTERKCRDGQSYHDGCNTVVCSGGHAIQTEMFCTEYDPITNTHIPTKELPAPDSFWES